MPSAHRPPPAPSGSPARRPRGPSWRPSATRPARPSSGSRRRWAAPSTSPGRGASRRLTPRRAGPGGAPAIGHVPSDGWLEPSKVAVGFTGRAAELGARILPFTRVTGIRRDGHCVAGVATTRGDVATPTVVDAAGGWTRVVARAAGLAVPLVTVRHQLYITEPIAGVLPLQPIGPSPRADRLRALRRWRGHVRGLRGRSPSHPAGIAPTGVPGGRPGARHRRSPSPDRRGGRTTFPSSAGRRWPSTAEVSPR